MLYAHDDWSPLSDITLALLLRRASIQWEYVPLHGLVEIVWPPVCGIHVLYVEREQTPGEKRYAVRHGLGHVLAGHVEDVSFAHDRHYPFGHEERVADLFALADVLPDRELEQRRGAGYRPWEIEWWVWCEIKRYAPSWPTARLVDRIGLRLAFYEEGR